MVNVKLVNPWKWQDMYGFSQAIEVQGAKRVVYCAGQTSVDENGNPMHKGDIGKQAGKALDNLEAVLKKCGLTLANIVRLNYYTTDLGAFMNASSVIGPRLAKAECQPSSTLLGVSGLFHPDIMIEIEATAVE
jgi:enamine deaminase RidA (YjgF/YER057c/UK114 family)